MSCAPGLHLGLQRHYSAIRAVKNPNKNVFLRKRKGEHLLNFEFFLARRMRTSSINESTVSARIIKIAVLAIAIGLVMMLVAIGTSLGLQREIKAKTIALSGDLRIAPFENNNSSLSVTPYPFSDEVTPTIESNAQAIEHAYPFVTKGVLLKTKNEFEGAILKGSFSTHFPWEELSSYLIERSLSLPLRHCYF